MTTERIGARMGAQNLAATLGRLWSIVLLLVLAATPAAAVDTSGASHADAARVLAGLPPATGSALEPLTRTSAFKQHEQAFSQSWTRLESLQISRIKAWREKIMPPAGETLFYFFSGPDYLYANAFFPEAKTYILAGLETVGPIPHVTEASLRGLPQLRGSLNTIMNYSFFKTVEMRSRFGSGQFTGTLPILYIFLARSGKTVEDVSLISLNEKGEVTASGGEGARPSIHGAKIVFSGDDGVKRTLYYFQTDVSDRGASVEQLLSFCKSFGKGDALIKSASYLLHMDNFSKVRTFLLDTAQTILEDDSGIPLRFFGADWNVKPLGRYAGPIRLFGNRHQTKLAELYRSQPSSPLPFGVGYRFRPNESSLLLATRKSP